MIAGGVVSDLDGDYGAWRAGRTFRDPGHHRIGARGFWFVGAVDHLVVLPAAVVTEVFADAALFLGRGDRASITDVIELHRDGSVCVGAGGRPS